jgi:hypothetical protein
MLHGSKESPMKLATRLGCVAMALVLTLAAVESVGANSPSHSRSKKNSATAVSKAIQRTLKSKSVAHRRSLKDVDGRTAVTYSIDVYWSRGVIQDYLKQYHWTVYYDDNGNFVKYDDYGAVADIQAMQADGYDQHHTEPVVESTTSW